MGRSISRFSQLIESVVLASLSLQCLTFLFHRTICNMDLAFAGNEGIV